MVFIKVRRLRFAFVSGAPLTVTLGFWGVGFWFRFAFASFGSGGQFFGLVRAAVPYLQFGFYLCLVWFWLQLAQLAAFLAGLAG